MSKAKASSLTITAQSTVSHRDTDTHRQVNIRVVQNVLLVWLDRNINESTEDCQNTITHLRRTVNTIKTYIDHEECIRFLKSMVDVRICMIISGALGQEIMPRIHELFQVDSIFIFCYNKVKYEGWARSWSKIKGVFTEIEPICEALQRAAQLCEQNAISLSIMVGANSSVEKSRNQLDPSFMYTKIMKEIFLTIKFEQKHIDEFLDHCRTALHDNERQLEYVNKLAQKYHEHSPIWWYTCECFLYPMLNRALRIIDVDLIIKMGFFIVDLHQHIKQLHQKQFGDGRFTKQFIVSRGQGMNKEAFEKMVASRGGLISFNNFLSTSKDDSISLAFAKSALADPQLVGVLFIMNIDPSRCNTPFASVVDGYYREQENEVLFSMNTVFRIRDIKSMNGNPRLVQVLLHSASDKDNDLHQLVDCIREQTFPESSGWYRLGSLLRKMGQSVKAEQVYKTLLRQETDDISKASIYHQLGVMKQEQAEYKQAIVYYKNLIEIEERQFPRRDQNLAMSYNNIGSVYYSMGAYPEALSSYEKALAIRQQSLPRTDLHLASSYNNIGLVYDHMGDHNKALFFLGNALTIRETLLDHTHPDLASSYSSIGNVHKNMGDYSKALLCYEKDLEISQKSLLPTHPSLAVTYSNIGSVHEKTGNYQKAYSYFKRAMDIAEKSLTQNHPEFQIHRTNLDRIKQKLQ